MYRTPKTDGAAIGAPAKSKGAIPVVVKLLPPADDYARPPGDRGPTSASYERPAALSRVTAPNVEAAA